VSFEVTNEPIGDAAHRVTAKRDTIVLEEKRIGASLFGGLQCCLSDVRVPWNETFQTVSAKERFEGSTLQQYIYKHGLSDLSDMNTPRET
jgi:hypothetical protein